MKYVNVFRHYFIMNLTKLCNPLNINYLPCYFSFRSLGEFQPKNVLDRLLRSIRRFLGV